MTPSSFKIRLTFLTLNRIFCSLYCISILVSSASSNQECILVTFLTKAKKEKQKATDESILEVC